MKPVHSLLLTLDGSAEAAKGLGAALWLAERLPATLHVLNASDEPQPAGEALQRLQVPEAVRTRLVLHQAVGPADAAVLGAIAAQGVQLVMMSARGASPSNARRTGHVAEAVLARSPVPVLLLPRHYREALPWRSMLVATSGEPAADQALQAATQLAAALDLAITVVHCADGGAQLALGRYADASHHEVPQRLDEMVRRAGPGGGPAVQVALCRGEPAEALLGLLAQQPADLLVLGWHGLLGPGRAQVLKDVLDRAECPVLVVREQPRPQARLKLAGEAGEAGEEGGAGGEAAGAAGAGGAA